ncbi:sporulation protein YunB [Bacillaceae bacterium SIJ1]|uniref:sporulation protein YunB n=1 Tax=Litoribacterium kuwaitense TaxID=1398745 RepID=UPI0013EC0014|nr:sporulation protein YunB [Litoribacterium kuwaitense]NGP46173.1 sporulation protein YunB [Litoribacterium kuwaitense]
MRKLYISRRRRRSLLISFLVFILLSIHGVWLVNKGIEPTIMDLAKTKTDELAREAINRTIIEDIVGGVDMRELVILHERPSNNVSYSFDPQVYNQLLSNTIQRVEMYLKDIEKGKIDDLNSFDAPEHLNNVSWTTDEQGIVYWVPLGVSTRNALLANLGPKVPVRFSLIGDVKAEIDTQISKVGINNTYLELFVDLTVQLNVIIPSTKEVTVVQNTIKIGDLFIEGDVPQFYQSSGSASPIVPVPAQPDDWNGDEE